MKRQFDKCNLIGVNRGDFEKLLAIVRGNYTGLFDHSVFELKPSKDASSEDKLVAA
jgi:hypothetical protein